MNTQMTVLVVASGRRAGQQDWGFGLQSAVESTVRTFKRVGVGGQDCHGTLSHWLAFFSPLSGSYNQPSVGGAK